MPYHCWYHHWYHFSYQQSHYPRVYCTPPGSWPLLQHTHINSTRAVPPVSLGSHGQSYKVTESHRLQVYRQKISWPDAARATPGGFLTRGLLQTPRTSEERTVTRNRRIEPLPPPPWSWLWLLSSGPSLQARYSARLLLFSCYRLHRH